MILPIGYHSLHPNVSMNFQMNPIYGCVGEPEMLEKMRTVISATPATMSSHSRGRARVVHLTRQD